LFSVYFGCIIVKTKPATDEDDFRGFDDSASPRKAAIYALVSTMHTATSKSTMSAAVILLYVFGKVTVLSQYWLLVMQLMVLKRYSVATNINHYCSIAAVCATAS
jgi:hypothetical protein